MNTVQSNTRTTFSTVKVYHTTDPSQMKRMQPDAPWTRAVLVYVASLCTTRDVRDTPTLEHVLDQAFELTNSIDAPWVQGRNPRLAVQPYEGGRRSTSVGDIMELVPASGASTWYLVAPVGFKRINPPA